MPRWLRRRDAGKGGEWSVADLQRGYRLCAYNHDEHGGPHIHIQGKGGKDQVEPTDIATSGEAEAVIRAYAEELDHFDLKRFRERVRTWRSASNRP